MSRHEETPTVRAQGRDGETSVFCKVFKANRSTCSPDSIDFGVVQNRAEHDYFSVLRGRHDAVLDVIGISVAKRPELLSVEVNLPRHCFTSLLLSGALIVALVKGKELTA